MKKSLVFGLAFALICPMVGCLKKKTSDDAGVARAVGSLAQKGLLDANDVSILIPLNLTSRFPASRFLTQAQYDQVLANGQGQGPNEMSRIKFDDQRSGRMVLSQWRVVSMRYDPCAPGSHAAEDFAKQQPGDPGTRAPGRDDFCLSQARLIIQPFVGDNLDADFTMHLVFSLPKSEAALAEQINGLFAIKEASERAGITTVGQALQEHPGLKSAKNNQEIIAAIDSFLTKNCNPKQILSVAVMGLADGGPEPWVFYSNRVKDGVVLPGASPIPTVESSSNVLATFQGFAFVGPRRVLGLASNKTTFPFVTTDDQARNTKLVELKRDPILLRSTTVILNSGLTE